MRRDPIRPPRSASILLLPSAVRTETRPLLAVATPQVHRDMQKLCVQMDAFMRSSKFPIYDDVSETSGDCPPRYVGCVVSERANGCHPSCFAMIPRHGWIVVATSQLRCSRGVSLVQDIKGKGRVSREGFLSRGSYFGSVPDAQLYSQRVSRFAAFSRVCPLTLLLLLARGMREACLQSLSVFLPSFVP